MQVFEGRSLEPEAVVAVREEGRVREARSCLPKAIFVLVCDRAPRPLEEGRGKVHERFSASRRDRREVVIGFDRHGEQLDGLHIAQTMVATAIGEVE